MRTGKFGGPALALAVLLATVSCGPPNSAAPGTPTTPGAPTAVPATGPLPRPDHVVVVVLENHGADQVLGSGAAPYLGRLAGSGATFTRAAAVTHPSQPNYLALFSGDTQGVADDSCPHTFASDSIGQQMIGAGFGFAGFSEDLPGPGYTGCQSGNYVRWHAPWVDFTGVPPTAGRPFSEFGPDYTKLPALSFVIPNMCHNMHDCDVATGDAWLRANLDAYVRWSTTHNSLLVVTFDEAEDGSATNQIPLIFAGPMVRPGRYLEPADHYRVLRTLEAMYGLPALGHAASTTPIADVWRG